MLSRIYRVFAVLMAFSIIFSATDVMKAQAMAVVEKEQVTLQAATSSPCSNLDVIFIVDQSDSMSRNDAIKNRKYAVEGMIDILVDLAMNQCPDSRHRIGVISFGAEERTRVDVELYDIDPGTATDARRIREELRPRVIADNLGSTYPEPAFVEAEKMFERNQVDEAEPRKKAIIFITDGLPCGKSGCEGSDYNANTIALRSLVDGRFSFASDLKSRESCLADVRKDYQNNTPPVEKTTACLESYPVSFESYGESTYLFTLLLHNSDEDYVPSAISQLDGMSQDYSGYVRKNQRQNQIPSSLREILSQLVGVRPSLLTGPSFAVNPYLNRMIVTAYKQSADVQFTLSYKDAEGTTHTIQGGQATGGFTLDPDNGYYQFGANETYTILNPYPGIWNMSTSNPSGLDVFYQPIQSDFRQTAPFSQIPQYDREPFFNEADPFNLEFTLFDDSNNGAVILQSDKALFAIDVQANVTDPDGKEITYPLKWDIDKKNFIAEQPLQVPLAGTYKISIVGKTRIHEGEPVVESANENQVFDKTLTLFSVDGEFSGLDVTPFEIVALSPVTGETKIGIHGTIMDGWPLPVSVFPVRVKITDENGNILPNPDSIFINQEDAITAQLTYLPKVEDGEEDEELEEAINTEIIILQPDPAVPGEFIGQFQNFGYEGSHILTLTVGVDKMEQGYWTYRREVKVEFSRDDCLMCRTSTYYGILGIIIATILTIIAYNIAIRTNKVSGSLILVDGSAPIAEFGLYNGTNFRKIKNRELDPYPQLALKYMKAQNIGKKRRTTKQRDEASGGLYSDEAQGIRVDCVSTNGRKFSVDLYPKTPTMYSDDTMAQMLFEPVE